MSKQQDSLLEMGLDIKSDREIIKEARARYQKESEGRVSLRAMGLEVQSDRDIIQKARARYQKTGQSKSGVSLKVTSLDMKMDDEKTKQLHQKSHPEILLNTKCQTLKWSLIEELIKIKIEEAEKLDNRCRFSRFFSPSVPTVKAINKFLALLNFSEITAEHSLDKDDLRALNTVDAIYSMKYQSIVKEVFARSAAIYEKVRQETVAVIL